jgi:multidrug resistance efflux pump
MAVPLVAIFKIPRVPLNKWTVTTAGIGGFVIIGGLLAAMNYNHPFTTNARLYFFTMAIVPQVKGRVIEVPVKPNVPLKKGDPLFKLDAAPANSSSSRNGRHSRKLNRMSSSSRPRSIKLRRTF